MSATKAAIANARSNPWRVVKDEPLFRFLIRFIHFKS
jgi:hypothetical protein